MESLIFIVFLFVIVWLLFLMPARRRQRSHKSMQDSVAPGDEIITAGGLHGIVRETDEEDLDLEIAPGVVVRLDRRAVAAVAHEEPDEPEEEPDDGAEPSDDGDEQPPSEEAEPAGLKEAPGTAEEGRRRP